MANQGLTTFALVFMLLSMGGVTVLATYCFYRILAGSKGGEPPPERESGHPLKL